MDDLRRLLKERYRKHQQENTIHGGVGAAEARCPDCGELTYQSKLCAFSGQYHDMDKKMIIGARIVHGRVINSSQLMEAIECTRVKWVPSRTQLVKTDAQSLNIFQSFVMSMDWKLQRYGVLYGTYDAESHVVEVHAIYEPEQVGSAYAFEYRTHPSDPRIDKVDTLAGYLGLRRVGCVCTHPPRDPDTIVLSAAEMLLCAREQSRFGDECVLLTMAPSVQEGAGGMVECQAWQVSPQCVNLYRMGMLHETRDAAEAAVRLGRTATAQEGVEGTTPGTMSSSSDMCSSYTNNTNTNKNSTRSPSNSTDGGSGVPLNRLSSGNCGDLLCTSSSASDLADPARARYVYSTIELEEAQQINDAKGHPSVITKAPSKMIDTRWFTSYIAVEHFDSTIVHGLFMRISRPGMAPPTFQNLRSYMNNSKRKGETFAQKIADFHVLIFLSELFSMKDDMPVLAEIAKTKVMTKKAKQYEELINAYMQ